MRRRLLIVVLALGTVLGFGAGFASLHHRGCGYRGGYGRAGFEDRVSELCAEAALRVQRGQGQSAAAPAAR